jgi:pyruvate/2-oxoglutarate dehydrogenase complex dihydrolipoamide dehydrogenase (E3) component
MQSKRHFDAIVIGAGQGGDPLARALAAKGKNTALIERKFVGGTCVNYGCTPTKALNNAARVAYLSRRSSDFGVTCGDVAVDMPRAIARIQGIVRDFREGTESKIQSTKNLELIYGQATFTGTRQLSMGEEELSADQIFINVGTRPLIPPIPGLQDVPFLDNAEILNIDVLPKHLIILGGGYISLEFGQMFRRFGSEVTIIEKSKRLIEREDDDVSQAVTDVLKEDGIHVLVGTEVKSVAENARGVKLELSSGEKIEGSHLLVAIGRTPNTNDLGLDKAGVKLDDRGYVVVDEKLQTNVEGVFALGDVKGGPAFTHISYDDYRILKANLLDGGSRTTKHRLVPYVMFLDPQLGRVGFSETEAKTKGVKVRVAKLNVVDIARPIEMSETRGFIKVLVDEKDFIVGVTTFCVEGGELLASLQIAMMAKLPYTALREGVFSHPTLSESLNNLFMKI